MSRNKKCPYYEVDLEAEKEAEAMEASYRELIGEEEYHLLMIQAEVLGATTDDPCAGCYGCRHFYSGPGFPGETVYACQHPSQTHIISTSFNESEII